MEKDKLIKEIINRWNKLEPVLSNHKDMDRKEFKSRVNWLDYFISQLEGELND